MYILTQIDFQIKWSNSSVYHKSSKSNLKTNSKVSSLWKNQKSNTYVKGDWQKVMFDTISMKFDTYKIEFKLSKLHVKKQGLLLYLIKCECCKITAIEQGKLGVWDFAGSYPQPY